MFELPAIILAAGGSSRCPEGKLLKPFRGRPLLEWTLKKFCDDPKVSFVLVVTGYRAEQTEELLKHFDKAVSVFNSAWKDGISSSLRIGVSALRQTEPGVLVTLGDTPFFRPQTLGLVFPRSNQIRNIRVPVHQGVPGHPKYFPAWLFPELQELQGDEGAKKLIRNYDSETEKLSVDDPGILRDFDRPEDFE